MLIWLGNPARDSFTSHGNNRRKARTRCPIFSPRPSIKPFILLSISLSLARARHTTRPLHEHTAPQAARAGVQMCTRTRREAERVPERPAAFPFSLYWRKNNSEKGRGREARTDPECRARACKTALIKLAVTWKYADTAETRALRLPHACSVRMSVYPPPLLPPPLLA